MAKDILTELEKLVGTLVSEANTPGNPEEGGPDFSDRLKAVDAATRFLIVKNKLVPPDKAKSMFEGMRDDLLSGTPSSRAGAPAKGKSRRPGVAAPASDDPDADDV